MSRSAGKQLLIWLGIGCPTDGPWDQIDGNGRGCTLQNDARAERQGAESPGIEDGYATHIGAQAALSVGVAAPGFGISSRSPIRAASSEGVLKVAGVGAAAENDLDAGGVPDGGPFVFALFRIRRLLRRRAVPG